MQRPATKFRDRSKAMNLQHQLDNVINCMVPVLLTCTLLAGQAMVAIRQYERTAYTEYRYEETLCEPLDGG